MYRPYSSSLADSRPFADVETVIRGLTLDFVTSFNTGNYDLVAALFSQDGTFMAPHHDSAYGSKSIERLMRQLHENGFEDLRLETVRVEHSGDMAMEIARYSVARRQPDGTTVPDRGSCLRVWRRLGAWLIVADCWSSDLPESTLDHADVRVA